MYWEERGHLNKYWHAISTQISKGLFSRWVSILIFPIAITIILVILLKTGTKISWRQIHFSLILLVGSFGIEILGLFGAIPIWRKLLSYHQISSGLWDDIRIYCTSMLGTLIPGGIWSMVGRATLYKKLGYNELRVVMANVVEILIIGISGLIVYAIANVLSPEINLFEEPIIGLLIVFLALILIQPRVFAKIAHWVLSKKKSDMEPFIRIYRFKDLIVWLFVECFVIVTGGLAIYVFLRSFIYVPISALIQVLAAWGIANAVSNLFFWLPGTPIVRDGTMVIALTPNIQAPSALLFVILIRIWSIVSILLLVGSIWLITIVNNQREKNRAVVRNK
jgi:hypothetical protein